MAARSTWSAPSVRSTRHSGSSPRTAPKHLRHRLDDRTRAVEVERELLALRTLGDLCGGFAGDRPSVAHGRLVEREVLAFAPAHRGAHRLDRLPGSPFAVGGRELAALGTGGGLGGEVDGDGVAGARQGGVGPLVGKGLRGADDLGALDGRPLAAVSGQRVGVLEVLGDIVDRQLAQVAVVGLDRHPEPFEVDGSHGAACAVVDVALAVVTARDNAVAHRHLELAELDPLAQFAPALAPYPSLVVEARAGDVIAGDHDRLLDAHPVHVGPPGGHGRLLGRLRAAVVNHQLAPSLFESDPRVWPARVQFGQRGALGRIALPHDVAQLVPAEPSRERAQPTAGLDARELARVADRHHLYPLRMGGGEHAGADPGRGHAGLVDQQHRRSRSESLAVAQVIDESVKRARRHTGAA